MKWPETKKGYLKKPTEDSNLIAYYGAGEVEGYNAAIDACKKAWEQERHEADELRCQLDAWQNIFGTTQLTHAQARLECAEKASDSLFQEIIELKKDKRDLESHLESMRGELDSLKQSPKQAQLDEKELAKIIHNYDGDNFQSPGPRAVNISRMICSKYGAPSPALPEDYVGKCRECGKFGHIKLRCDDCAVPPALTVEQLKEIVEKEIFSGANVTYQNIDVVEDIALKSADAILARIRGEK